MLEYEHKDETTKMREVECKFYVYLKKNALNKIINRQNIEESIIEPEDGFVEIIPIEKQKKKNERKKYTWNTIDPKKTNYFFTQKIHEFSLQTVFVVSKK